MKRNEAQRILSATMALALLTGICATVFGMNFRHEISLLLASGDPVQALVLEKYLFYLLLAAPVILLISIFSKFLTQAGAPGLASRLLILSNGMSVLFCYLLLAFGGFAAEGAALGVLLGYMTALAGTAYLIFAGRVPGRGCWYCHPWRMPWVQQRFECHWLWYYGYNAADACCYDRNKGCECSALYFAAKL